MSINSVHELTLPYICPFFPNYTEIQQVLFQVRTQTEVMNTANEIPVLTITYNGVMSDRQLLSKGKKADFFAKEK